MTKRLTHIYSKQKPNKNIVWIFVLIIALLCILVFSCIASIVKTKPYSAKNFYILYADKFTSSTLASNLCTKVSDAGGAGIIYNIGNTKFVVINIYKTESDAKQIKENVIAGFSESDIIKITAPELSKTISKKIDSDLYAKQYYLSLNNLCNKLYNLCISFDKGELDSSKIYKEIMKDKQNIATLSVGLKEKTLDYQQTMYSSSLLVLSQVSTFFDSSFAANNVGKYIKKLYVNIVLEFVDMCTNLK